MKRICVSRSLESQLKTFIGGRGIDIEVVSSSYDSSNDILIDESGDQRQESNLRILYKGGFISCNNAWGLADMLGMSFSQMGALLDHLDVKIKQCQLGCF